jgi:hypothetical protein
MQVLRQNLDIARRFLALNREQLARLVERVRPETGGTSASSPPRAQVVLEAAHNFGFPSASKGSVDVAAFARMPVWDLASKLRDEAAKKAKK